MEKSWEDDKELGALLEQFVDEYNDRPHQGLEVSAESTSPVNKWLQLGSVTVLWLKRYKALEKKRSQKTEVYTPVIR